MHSLQNKRNLTDNKTRKVKQSNSNKSADQQITNNNSVRNIWTAPQNISPDGAMPAMAYLQ